MKKLILILCLLPSMANAKSHRYVQDRAWERHLTRLYGANGTLSRARRNCADYSHGWIVDDRRDQPHWYYCVPAEDHPELTCETDPVMARSPGQYCVENK